MKLVVRIFFITAAIFLSVLVFYFFLLQNFPYDKVFVRLNYELKKKYDVGISVTKTDFIFPGKFVIKNVVLYLPVNRGVEQKVRATRRIKIPEIQLKIGIFSFSKWKKINFSAQNILLNTDNIDGVMRGVEFESWIKLRNFKKGVERFINRALLKTGSSILKKISVSGLEVENIKIYGSQIALVSSEEGFTVEEGFVKSDLLEATIEGFLSESKLNIDIFAKPYGEIYERHPEVKPILSSMIGERGIIIKIRGSVKEPRINYIKG